MNDKRDKKRFSDQDIDDFLVPLTEFLDGVESGILQARQRIREMKSLSNNLYEKPYDVETIEWEQATGAKGVYQRSQDWSNPDFEALLKDLEKHDGKFRRDGFFYWKFRGAGSTIGRKRV